MNKLMEEEMVGLVEESVAVGLVGVRTGDHNRGETKG